MTVTDEHRKLQEKLEQIGACFPADDSHLPVIAAFERQVRLEEARLWEGTHTHEITGEGDLCWKCRRIAELEKP